MADPDLGTAPLETIVDALRAGRLSAAAIADWAVANHEARGEAFHAYKTFDAGRVRAEAGVADAARATRNDLGPLQGIRSRSRTCSASPATRPSRAARASCRTSGGARALSSGRCAANSRSSAERPTPSSSPMAGSAPTPIGARRAIHGTRRRTARPAARARAPGSACGKDRRCSRSARTRPARCASRPR